MHLPEVHLDPVQSARLRQGQKLAGVRAEVAGLVRVYDHLGFFGIGESDGGGTLGLSGCLILNELTNQRTNQRTNQQTKIKGVSPTLRLQGEFLLANDPKGTKKSGAQGTAGFADTLRYSVRAAVAQLTRYGSAPALLGPLAQTAPSLPPALRSDTRSLGSALPSAARLHLFKGAKLQTGIPLLRSVNGGTNQTTKRTNEPTNQRTNEPTDLWVALRVPCEARIKRRSLNSLRSDTRSLKSA